jgi:ATP-dependent RNA circularization protein (DNA/RNA ligase family)
MKNTGKERWLNGRRKMLRNPRKYEKTYRIEVPWYDIQGKKFMSEKEEKKLFSGRVTVSEKLDGANVAIYKDWYSKLKLQKRGSWIDNSHLQYKFLNEIHRLNKGFFRTNTRNCSVIYMELMYCQHSIPYERLTDYLYILDVFMTDHNRYMKLEELKEFSQGFETPMAPIIYHGKLKKEELKEIMPKKSLFGPQCEGIVIHNEKRNMRAKLVKPEFLKAIEDDEHWSKRKPIINKLNPAVMLRQMGQKLVTFTGV